MKRLTLNLLSLAFALVALCSCNKAKNISVDNDKVIFAVMGGEKTVTVTADGSYAVEDCPEWLKTDKGENTLTLSTEANTTGATRDCVIHLVGADGLSVPIAVIQPDKCTFINASPAELFFDKEGGSKDVAIETDGANLNVEVGDGISAQYADGKLSVSVPANEGGTKNGHISLTCDQVKTEINVTVEGSICQRCGGRGTIKCPSCHGKGGFDGGTSDGSHEGCSTCGGRGWYFPYDNTSCDLDGYGRPGRGYITCPDCGGAGH